MSSGSFKNVFCKLSVYKSHYMYKEIVALNNLQWLICQKIQQNQILYI